MSDVAFFVTITDADNRSLKPLHTLFDKHLDHMLVKFKHNSKARNKVLSFLTKMDNHFLETVDAILEEFSVTLLIVDAKLFIA